MTKPEEMTVAEYNDLMMEEAFKMLMMRLEDAEETVAELNNEIADAKWQATKMRSAHKRKVEGEKK